MGGRTEDVDEIRQFDLNVQNCTKRQTSDVPTDNKHAARGNPLDQTYA